MDKDTILNTVVIQFNEDDGCFVAKSPLLEVCVGAGGTEKDALISYREHLETHYKAHLEGKHPSWP